MTDKNEARRHMTAYLLGEMPAGERARFEEQFARDSALFEELVDVENDLVDRYARGRLTEGERAGFERYYLAAPKRHARAEAARLLADCLLTEQSAIPVDRVPDPGLEASPNPIFSVFHRAMIGVAVAATVGLFLAACLVILALHDQRLRRELVALHAENGNLTRDKNQLRQEVASLTQHLAEVAAQNSQKAEPPLISASKTALFTLAPGLSRSGNRENRLVISNEVAQVVLQLKLDRGSPSLYRAVLETSEGNLIWRAKHLSSTMTRDHGRIVRIVLPARILPAGDYILKLDSSSVNGLDSTVDAYSFRIVLK